MVPIAGGLIGGTVDAVSTNIIGNVARKIFIEDAKVNKSLYDSEPIIIDMQ